MEFRLITRTSVLSLTPAPALNCGNGPVVVDEVLLHFLNMSYGRPLGLHLFVGRRILLAVLAQGDLALWARQTFQ